MIVCPLCGGTVPSSENTPGQPRNTGLLLYPTTYLGCIPAVSRMYVLPPTMLCAVLKLIDPRLSQAIRLCVPSYVFRAMHPRLFNPGYVSKTAYPKLCIPSYVSQAIYPRPRYPGNLSQATYPMLVSQDMYPMHVSQAMYSMLCFRGYESQGIRLCIPRYKPRLCIPGYTSQSMYPRLCILGRSMYTIQYVTGHVS
jgi:hypothetical protein